ncbi:Fic family protein [Natranaerobius thermophilus]|uniref:Filamentation induced by cAMP protein Fic n=1 Tax=Natranaerobius thermophilus (strain ATCC BAA-1301 / DSM 18059 / JW/NM-WN-LF) TaxID=457570 RepID=B2A1S5_NATTJ|nr:Fic family protein [Natranaerobius thermophilus]ACB86122.1 filamentation induced by cAMP protein Fic [Natranaerobius thermophilus JW/NM-WN-LF]
MFKELEEKKQKLDEKRPLSKEQVKQLKQYFDVEFTYNSNAIEGNTLSLRETKVILEDGITVGKGKSMREHLEVINHKEAIDYIENLIKEKADISEKIIKEVHYLVLKGIDDDNAGKYRTTNVLISGSDHKPPEHYLVPEKMEKLVSWYKNKQNKLHTIELATYFHHHLTSIHPFVDGNGRLARLLMNFILVQDGYPLTVIKAEDRESYMEALELASTKMDYSKLLEMMEKAVNDSFETYFYIC